jgi:hypothetical protein
MMPDSLGEARKILERENQADLRLTVEDLLNYRGDDRGYLVARDVRPFGIRMNAYSTALSR